MRFTTGGFVLLLLLANAITACRKDQESPKGALAPKAVANHNSSRFVACLTENTDLCSLLSPDLLQSMLPQDTLAAADTSTAFPSLSELRAVDNLPEMNQCVFSWNSDRMDTLVVDGYSYPYPVTNEVGVGEVRIFKAPDDSSAVSMAEKAFRSMFRNHSESETDSIRMQMEQDMLFANDSLYLSMDRQLAYSQRYTQVPGIADTAVWDAFSHKLVILEGPVIFKVMSQVHDDDAQNRELASAIAREVLKRCR